MSLTIYPDPVSTGSAAGKAGAELIRQAILKNGEANVILATGTSQYETLKQLIAEDISWELVNMFHLDEYIGLPLSHGASFRKYLTERFIQKVSNLRSVTLIDGENDPVDECQRLAAAIALKPIDVAFVGIGENGHLAFNDPPADFDTTDPYIVVQLDQACREQQLGEGWFKNLEEVPELAISMSIHQIMLSKHIICTVPDLRKSMAVKNCLTGKPGNLHPASKLQEHLHCHFFLDTAAASLLPGKINL